MLSKYISIYKCPNWMNPNIISSLRDRSKLTKRYYSNPTEENKNLLTAKSNERVLKHDR